MHIRVKFKTYAFTFSRFFQKLINRLILFDFKTLTTIGVKMSAVVERVTYLKSKLQLIKDPLRKRNLQRHIDQLLDNEDARLTRLIGVGRKDRQTAQRAQTI